MVKQLAVIVAILSVIGCGPPSPPNPPGDNRAFLAADSWYSPPSGRDGFAPLEKDRFAPVIEQLQRESQAALGEKAVKPVTADEAARLVGRPMPVGAAYVLLRGVVLFEGTGSFSVSVNGTAVDVHHGCLSRGPAPMTRKAIVAVLPAVPDTVFVSCTMAQ